ncbi:predicted protein [Histoplasma capsulatum var. duboisii H88]|uniref:Predicted protein n=1 Tax=Ajellomyces capsulatus (strain H88) TaxID=544711 RepID=F0UAK9_AJEC8|nr:predicted protein [Histoplasma capsulatum var. duboisii H88]
MPGNAQAVKLLELELALCPPRKCSLVGQKKPRRTREKQKNKCIFQRNPQGWMTLRMRFRRGRGSSFPRLEEKNRTTDLSQGILSTAESFKINEGGPDPTFNICEKFSGERGQSLNRWLAKLEWELRNSRVGGVVSAEELLPASNLLSTLPATRMESRVQELLAELAK